MPAAFGGGLRPRLVLLNFVSFNFTGLNAGITNLGGQLLRGVRLNLILGQQSLCPSCFRRELRKTAVSRGQVVLGCTSRSLKLRSAKFGCIGIRACRQGLRDYQPKRLRFANDFGGHFLIGFRSRDWPDSQQFLVAGNQIAFFVQISNNDLGGLVNGRPDGNRAQLPNKWSLKFPGFDRKFSNEGFSISSISPELR